MFNIEKYYFWNLNLDLSYAKIVDSIDEGTIEVKAKSQCTQMTAGMAGVLIQLHPFLNSELEER
jgi:hypothetical protein